MMARPADEVLASTKGPLEASCDELVEEKKRELASFEAKASMDPDHTSRMIRKSTLVYLSARNIKKLPISCEASVVD
jgi:hypothetical protein